MLRVKGLLDVAEAGPLAVSAVQHMVHRPEHLPMWPEGPRHSRVVLITRGLGQATVERSLRLFLAAAASPVRAAGTLEE